MLGWTIRRDRGVAGHHRAIDAGVLPKTQQAWRADGDRRVGDHGHGPWAWANLRKSGVDFDIAPLPGVGGAPGKPFVGVQTAFINRSSPNGDFAMQFLERFVCTVEGLRALDADAPLGVPAVKALAEEMSAKSPLIKGTYENALNGVVMPNIPQMGKFWSSMKAAFETATNGDATPEAALKSARQNMER